MTEFRNSIQYLFKLHKHPFVTSLVGSMLIVVSGAVYSAVEIESALQDELQDDSTAVLKLPEIRWTFETVHPGDSLSGVFRRAGVKSEYAFKMMEQPGSEMLQVIHPNDELSVARNSQGGLLGLEFRRKGKSPLIYLIENDNIILLGESLATKYGSLVAFLNSRQESAENERKPNLEIDEAKLVWRSKIVKRGDTLGTIFKQLGLPVSEAVKVSNASEDGWLRVLRVEQELRIATYKDGTFAKIEAKMAPLSIYSVSKIKQKYYSWQEQIEVDYQQHSACSSIDSNFFLAGKKVGFPELVLNAYIEIFSSNIDFVRQTRKGDEFCIVYEQGYLHGDPVGKVIILAAKFDGKKKQVEAYRFVDEYGRVFYYDQNGESMRNHFLRSPLKYTRVTSIYSHRRFHPVHKKFLPHNGVDLGAKMGTPVHSTANGIIKFMGRKGGYGKTIIVQHGSKYETLYAHLSRYGKGLRIGKSVEQAQVIGYVGATGIVTGPHLHYEFRVYGTHRNPMSYDLPKGEPIPEQYQAKFEQIAEKWSKIMNSIEQPLIAYTPSSGE